MKKVFLTLVIGLITMIGFSQVVKVKVTKRQEFEHSNQLSTPEAFETGLSTYLKSYIVDGTYFFDLDKNIMTLEYFTKDGKKISNQYPIIKKYKTTNLVDVLVGEDNEPDMLFVLGNRVVDNSYVLITNMKEGDKIKGSFYPDCEVTVNN